ncbi:pentatricopeptide repeat-containing protein At1g30610, chloroplastic-like [Zingiber officinale]|uniref:pentatricopeptide repeat-containing protein At1g30610, chloroplastic-like n=1 Tax=Zingiber officinale TaxID=94328 RepID=UPI001C4D3360|nr:pentatricopeptide repeat-containing protein At1g30610, chloroplastic-like [Zingiber officinale]
MMLANRPMGLLGSGDCRSFSRNAWPNVSSFQGISILPRRFLGRASVLRMARRRRDLDGGSSKGRIFCAFEDMGSVSASSIFLEKEFTFTPAFDDYVKVLESVRTDRSRHTGDGEEEGSKKRPVNKGKSFRMKQQHRSVRNDDSKQRPNAVENSSRSERVAVRGRNKDLEDATRSITNRSERFSIRVRTKDLEDATGSKRNKSADRWGLDEGLLQKGTPRRNGNTSNLHNNGNGNSRTLRKFHSQDKLYDTGEDAEGYYFVKGKVSHLERQMDISQKNRKIVGVDKLETSKGNNAKHSNYSHSSGGESRPRRSKPVSGELTESNSPWSSNDDLNGGIDDHEISYINDHHPNDSKVANTVHGYVINNSVKRLHSTVESIQRKSEELVMIKKEQNAKKFYASDTSNVSPGSNMTTNHKLHLTRDHGLANTRLRRSGEELKLEDENDGQNMHVNSWVGKQNNDKEQIVKRNKFSLSKKYDGHDRQNWNSGMNANGLNTSKMLSDVNLDTSNFSRDADCFDSEDRAAFKTFEVFTDVRNRPRVLRMELEERIQNLAKQLNAADINIPQWKFSKMIHNARIKFTDHSILRIVQILGKHGNWRRVLQVVEWFQSRERFKSLKSRYVYTSVLDVLGKAKRPIEALNIFQAMRQGLSSYPDLAAYHCIAVTLGQAGLMKELFDVMDCMQAVPEKKFNLGPLQKWDPRLEPDLVVYNAVLNACVTQKQWEGAFWVLQQLKQRGIKPSNTTYGLIMEVMLACGKYSLVHEFFRKVEKTSVPGALNYKVLVNALWREGKIDEAVAAVQDMEKRGIIGTASLYYDLARCLCSSGRCQEALLQIKKICKVAKKPLVVTYTGLIHTCIDSGSIENGAFVFNQMHKFCLPNIVTCNIMLKSYLGHGMFEEAKDLFQKILAGGYQNVDSNGLSQRVVPDNFTFNTMIESYAQRQKWDDFENVYRQMLNQGFHFNTKRHMRMMLDAFRAGKILVLESTWKHLVRFERVPPIPIIKERFCMKLVEEDHPAAFSCLDILQEIDIHAFSERSWLNLLNNNAHRFKSDTILRLVDELDALTAQNRELPQVKENLRKACKQFVSQVNDVPRSPNHLEVACNS